MHGRVSGVPVGLTRTFTTLPPPYTECVNVGHTHNQVHDSHLMHMVVGTRKRGSQWSRLHAQARKTHRYLSLRIPIRGPQPRIKVPRRRLGLWRQAQAAHPHPLPLRCLKARPCEGFTVTVKCRGMPFVVAQLACCSRCCCLCCACWPPVQAAKRPFV